MKKFLCLIWMLAIVFSCKNDSDAGLATVRLNFSAPVPASVNNPEEQLFNVSVWAVNQDFQAKRVYKASEALSNVYSRYTMDIDLVPGTYKFYILANREAFGRNPDETYTPSMLEDMAFNINPVNVETTGLPISSVISDISVQADMVQNMEIKIWKAISKVMFSFAKENDFPVTINSITINNLAQLSKVFPESTVYGTEPSGEVIPVQGETYGQAQSVTVPNTSVTKIITDPVSENLPDEQFDLHGSAYVLENGFDQTSDQPVTCTIKYTVEGGADQTAIIALPAMPRNTLVNVKCLVRQRGDFKLMYEVSRWKVADIDVDYN